MRSMKQEITKQTTISTLNAKSDKMVIAQKFEPILSMNTHQLKPQWKGKLKKQQL
jgi:hypothetical protein